MTLTIPFVCNITMQVVGKNYTGDVTLSPRGGNPQVFYFTVLNPNDPSIAEMSIYNDVERNIVFAEALGKAMRNEQSELVNAIGFDFSEIEENPQIMSVTFVLSIIINATIKIADQGWDDPKVREMSSIPFNARLRSKFEMDFMKQNEAFPLAFLESFGIYGQQ